MAAATASSLAVAIGGARFPAPGFLVPGSPSLLLLPNPRRFLAGPVLHLSGKVCSLFPTNYGNYFWVNAVWDINPLPETFSYRLNSFYWLRIFFYFCLFEYMRLLVRN